MKYSILKIASILGIKNQNIAEGEISLLLTDSRKLSSPQETLFFAIETKQNDAHKFISDLYGSGVRNFVVTKLFPEWKSFTDVNFLKVTNTLHALQKLAAYHRKQFSIPVIGITGSNGKTIVKEWLYQLLEEDYNITRSPRSYNSQTGVPLSVWEMTENTTLAIFEAGISQPDEMKYLEPVIRPTIGVFTKLGEAHQENFSSQQQKCMEKMELFVNSNVFIYEEDNKIINQSADRMVLSQKSFCWSRKDPDAPLYIRKTEKNGNKTTIHYSFLNFEYSVSIPFTDEASIENAISCLAVMLYLNVKPGTISERMMKLEPVAMRLDVRQGKNNCTIINDTYNSDINSIKIALDFQQQRKVEQSLKKTLIISDILQTGLLPKSLYKHVAELVQQSGIEKLIGIGHDICENSEVFTVREKHFFRSTEDFIRSNTWKEFENELILLKGARRYHFEQINELLEQRIHETVLEVDLDALVHNFNFYKSRISPQTKLICMVKANGYGAGAVEIAKTLQYHRCAYFAVAVAEEGIELRKEGISTPIIVLNPEVNGFEELFSKDLEPEVYNFRILDAFIREAERRGITNYPIHLKIDTGMHRLGFLPAQIPELLERLKSQKGLKVKSVFSHLAASESWMFDSFTQEQIDIIDVAHREIGEKLGYPVWKHILNSAGIERFINAQWDMVRLGIGLYGVSASGLNGLKNVSTLKTTILQIQEIPNHETVGYGRKEALNRDAKIATIRIGYADGLDRKSGNRKGKVWINGKYAPIVGNVCMDLCMIDITGIDAKEGDSVIVFGENLPVLEVAESIDTIPYEILTSISPRVKRIYVKE
ncbi:bifunctional UDP-N-acetylmuramoyl-tripeptide:D-alanyl-D-alanine ligase/alanine racemase [Petrimonas sulfuriphila]|jgi:alanine racemase|uniref:bifunctional UDP-N-acetylmuramoyl-tripeptide:D-alanyl-D-alanine ligase/alanine racemase n=1 Tax=Petrimonas TaxID=307628 RepID=UPI000E8BF1B8|nr:bifunctional UDP-N-acetylmuramoyl-tripeptide:D-alanyl-D-alanine ligase/alanine racemase [Petrimonas sp.]NLU28505.1 bifunctional UDP-N-acetylmuramoyl-tripeptide:D-alanyl-D-alanine ligase/alanine racemase [Bacteroidales bacterium]HBC37864.1 bifunctional UDP-N-acetylmuramoyl-tripeptide:D-alanyl-D-alanine ligase/alanine racemase [Porphyromonadaceae bacterium]HBK93768.1 bifunctional UDP-N-acetylmuramoyl-tripeptide:D-alanyl-D-alanine ligase/alanine racemase [Porphyromonadaceae bacterium]HBU45850.1